MTKSQQKKATKKLHEHHLKTMKNDATNDFRPKVT
jgi:hypothetical protein